MPSMSPQTPNSRSGPLPGLFPSIIGSVGKLRSTNNSRSATPRLSPSPTRARIRPRLSKYRTIDDAVSLLKSSTRIMVLTGAGISTSLGIPDFRSSTGLYTILQAAGYDDPQELFHIDNFLTNPATFWESASMIIPKVSDLSGSAGVQPRYSTTHAFLAILQSKDKLLTNYTQNIDGLEHAAGIQSEKLVHCHGNWSTATCITCGKSVPARKYLPVVYQEKVPYCKCSQLPTAAKLKKKSSKKRKRYEYEDTDESDDGTQGPTGLLKPDITFFGEGIPQTYLPRLEADKEVVDLLIVIGTSLKVHPVNEIPLALPQHVPQIWICKERCQRDGVKMDVELLGECDVIIHELCRRAGWLKSLGRFSWKTPEKATADRPVKKAKDPPSTMEAVQTDAGTGKVNVVNNAPTGSSSTSRALPIRSASNDTVEKLSHSTVAHIADVGKSIMDNTMVKKHVNTPEAEVSVPALVEREEGTDWRWFIRPPKPPSRG